MPPRRSVLQKRRKVSGRRLFVRHLARHLFVFLAGDERLKTLSQNAAINFCRISLFILHFWPAQRPLKFREALHYIYLLLFMARRLANTQPWLKVLSPSQRPPS
jgi:hypothetical protein